MATYRVSGAQAASAEKFFHEKYGMGNLKFTCCGWEPENGRNGQVESAALKKINPNYGLLIGMGADDGALPSNGSEWRDKRKARYFTVRAEIVDV